MRTECYSCHDKTVKKLIDKFKPESEIVEKFSFAIAELLNNNKQTNPYIATFIHRLARKHFNHNNLYKEEKNKANQILLEKYHFWKDFINKSQAPLFTAAKLAVAGNIIDYGAHSAPENIEAEIMELVKSKLSIDNTEELFVKIKSSKSIFYIGDNAGEIVFDKLFIETMIHHSVTYAVRGAPVINDVTFYDATQTGIDKICRVISNGYDAPSTLLEFCSEEFIREFNKADLIISKGQGNFEGLMNSGRNNLFFLLIAKCDPIADMLGVKKGNLVITKLKN